VADLSVSYEYLDDLAATLGQIAALVRLDDPSSAVDHSVTESASVQAAGEEIVTFQTALSSTLADNIEVMGASVADASTTLAEADAALAGGASAGAAPGDSGRSRRSGGGTF
jgi:hypothetical protein